jgi:hypothetical protein
MYVLLHEKLAREWLAGVVDEEDEDWHDWDCYLGSQFSPVYL